MSKAGHAGYRVVWRKEKAQKNRKKRELLKEVVRFFFGRLPCVERNEMVLGDKTETWEPRRTLLVNKSPELILDSCG